MMSLYKLCQTENLVKNKVFNIVKQRESFVIIGHRNCLVVSCCRKLWSLQRDDFVTIVRICTFAIFSLQKDYYYFVTVLYVCYIMCLTSNCIELKTAALKFLCVKWKKCGKHGHLCRAHKWCQQIIKC